MRIGNIKLQLRRLSKAAEGWALRLCISVVDPPISQKYWQLQIQIEGHCILHVRSACIQLLALCCHVKPARRSDIASNFMHASQFPNAWNMNEGGWMDGVDRFIHNATRKWSNISKSQTVNGAAIREDRCSCESIPKPICCARARPNRPHNTSRIRSPQRTHEPILINISGKRATLYTCVPEGWV